MFENEVYPGIYGGLESLRGHGHRLWVVTSKPTIYAEGIVDHFGLRRWFDGVQGSDPSGSDADKRHLIRNPMSLGSIAPREACVVGDRHARRAGRARQRSKVYRVRWGYGSAEELREAEPDHLVASMSELCEIVQSEGRP